MNLSDKDNFLGRWANNQLSDEEKEDFERSEDFEIYQRIMDRTSGLSVPDFDTEVLLAQVKTKARQKPKQVVRLILSAMAVAASLLILITFYFFMDSNQEIITGYGQMAEQFLPDSTKVRLNAQSTIEFSDKDWEDRRVLSMRGEAFFEVKKGSPFTIETVLGQVQVLGTSFNVYVRDQLLEVTCYEGKVKVNGAEEVYLTAGQSYRQVKGAVEPLHKSASQPMWLDKQSNFDNSPINHVLTALSNQYGLTFEGNIPPDSLRVTLSFPNDNQALATELIFKSIQKSYQLKSDKVVIID